MEEIEQINILLHSRLEEERLQGLRALGRSGPETHLGLVYQALGDESWRVRKEAVQLFLSAPGAGALSGEVVDLLHSEDNAGLRNAAVEILIRLGVQAVPFLIEELSCNDHDVRKFVLDILGDIGDESCIQPMLRALSDPDENVKAAAAENLGKIKAAEAVPALLDSMEQADLWLRFTILESLAQIGQTVPVARLLVFAEERLLRKALFDCLGRIGGTDAAPTLLQGLTDDMRNVREAAIVALDRISTSFPGQLSEALRSLAGTRAAEVVAGALESADAALRQSALRLMRGIGDERFAQQLLALFDNELLREEAAATLVSLGRSAACSLMGLWDTADSRARAYLAFIFGESQCTEGVGLLLEGLSDPDPELRLVAAQALGKLGAAVAIAPLVTALVDAHDDVRDVATQALCRLSHFHPAEALNLLRPLLEGDDSELRMHVVSVFGQMEGGDVESILAFALKDESPLVRRAAVRACEGRSGSGRLSTLMLALTDEDAEVRRLAAESLGMTANRQAVAPLELALQDEDIWVRAAAVRALGMLGGADVLAPVSLALHDPVGLVAIAALETIAGLDSERAYAAMVQCLGHADEEVVNAALTLLAASGRRDWLPDAVEPLFNHRHWEVRSTFARTLAGLEGARCRRLLEERLLLEGEELVRQLLQDLLADLRDVQG